MSDRELRQQEREWKENPTDENAASMMRMAARHGNPAYAAWLRWLEGHWTQNPPTVPGCFLRATRPNANVPEGPEVVWPPIFVYLHENSLIAMRNSTTHNNVGDAWKGFWWSEPMPEMAPPVASTLDKSSNNDRVTR